MVSAPGAADDADLWVRMLKDLKEVGAMPKGKPKNLMETAETLPPVRRNRRNIVDEVKAVLSKVQAEEACPAWWVDEFAIWKEQFGEHAADVNSIMPSSATREASKGRPKNQKPTLATRAASGGSTSVELTRTKSKSKLAAPLEPLGPGFPALCVAAQAGRHGMASLLLASGADVNQRCENELGATALHLAAAAGHVKVGRVLVAAGADTKAKDRRGQTPLQLAVKQGFQDFVAAIHCTCGDWMQMAGWGPQASFVLCPADTVADEDVPSLVDIFASACARWEECVSRRFFTVVSSREEAKHAQGTNTHVIHVAFGEWNTKNGYTAPKVRPNRWPYRRCGAKIMLRKRTPEEVAPRSVTEAMVSTACHELGHALGLPHHPVEGELMHFLGLPRVSDGAGDAFGTDCAAAARWLYRPALPASLLKRGYPCLCMKCYAPAWWSIAARGEFARVDSAEFLSKSKPKRNPHTRRRMETLPDGTSKLVTEAIAPEDDDDVWGSESGGSEPEDGGGAGGEVASGVRHRLFRRLRVRL